MLLGLTNVDSFHESLETGYHASSILIRWVWPALYGERGGEGTHISVVRQIAALPPGGDSLQWSQLLTIQITIDIKWCAWCKSFDIFGHFGYLNIYKPDNNCWLVHRGCITSLWLGHRLLGDLGSRSQVIWWPWGRYVFRSRWTPGETHTLMSSTHMSSPRPRAIIHLLCTVFVLPSTEHICLKWQSDNDGL